MFRRKYRLHTTVVPLCVLSRIILCIQLYASCLMVGVCCGGLPFCGGSIASNRWRPDCRFRMRPVMSTGFGGSGLTGKWGCVDIEGDVNGYWKACGLPYFARKGMELMEWGKGKVQNVRSFNQTGDSITMEYSFTGGGLGALSFTEIYDVGKGKQQVARVGNAKVIVEPEWEENDVLRITNYVPEHRNSGWTSSLRPGFIKGKESPENDPVEVKPAHVLDVHRFYMREDDLILEADASHSGGPKVKWVLRQLE